MNHRLHNIIFALLIGAIFGATAYAVHVRAPGLGCSHYSVQLPKEAQSRESKGKTERMIESGELSDHPAKYYRILQE